MSDYKIPRASEYQRLAEEGRRRVAEYRAKKKPNDPTDDDDDGGSSVPATDPKSGPQPPKSPDLVGAVAPGGGDGV